MKKNSTTFATIWLPERITSTVRDMHREGMALDESSVQAAYPDFYKAARHLYGSWQQALQAAGVRQQAR